jgi:hypothetical protein
MVARTWTPGDAVDLAPFLLASPRQMAGCTFVCRRGTCSIGVLTEVPADRITMVRCGSELTPATIEETLAKHHVQWVVIASWWFDHPVVRSAPELWLPAVRDFAPDAGELGDILTCDCA